MAPHSLASLCFLFLILSSRSTLSIAAAPASDSICTIPSHPPKHLDESNDHNALALHNLFQLNAGYFFGGEEDVHFAKDDGNASYVTRSFSFFPHSVDSTTDRNLVHVAATLTLSGGRNRSILLKSPRRRHSFVGDHSVSFYLDGYYSATSDELCVKGKGTYLDDDGNTQRLDGVVLKLRMPSRSKLSDSFVTGRLKGASFDTVSLVAYAEGAYHYTDTVSCPSLQPPPTSTARGAFQALGSNFSCAHLKEHLATAYKLQYALGSSPLKGIQARRMHVGQVQCSEFGEVRAYAAFTNDTEDKWWWHVKPRPPFMAGDEVVVVEGRWDYDRSTLCLTACRAVYSDSEMSVEVKECGIGMSFWFPGAWSIRDRSIVAGRIWNSSKAAGGITGGSGVISVSSIDADNHRSNFSDVTYEYDYTVVEEARKHYLNDPVLSDPKKKDSFIAPNYTDHDFAFNFYEPKEAVGSGHAYPVTIGSVMVYGDQLAADDSFSRHAAVDMNQELINVSYDIRHHVPPEGWVRPKNQSSYSVSLHEHRITAEGVFDPKTGVMCMIGCREHTNTKTTDCRILITVHFTSMDEKAQQQGRGKGAISSLRDKATDPLFFEKIEIVLYGMYSEQLSESVSRMDMESVMLVVSTTLPCVFTVLQIFHVKRRLEAAAAMSITMLVILALGYVVPLLVSSEALFLSRRSQYEPTMSFLSYVPYELSQAMMRAPTLIALLLQLRLIQLAWSARKKKTGADDGSKAAAASSAAAAEKRALWLCVPLYLIGGALTIFVHVVNARRTAAVEASSVTVRLGPEPATLWEDLVSSAGLALDAFLLPQVAMNALSAGAAVTALSPWFYAGGTVVRAMPHIYDVIRAQGYVPSLRPSYVYASPRYDRFGVGWDVVVPCGAALLAVLVFLQQRVRLVAAPLFPPRKRLGEYEMVSNL